ncbi:MAG: SURF1 family protein [Anaerolineales bacterium]|uniref:SURF1 family protein n=1 Tax=Promineifilum sp. TaxID=2664178 RepID=UPI001D957C1E|nr:SURF1 family protein [Anaerolineales bacterium]MCB8936235.1 SURF1 family protein [Promineifilum sp.]MCO5181827.1 SURF1 family protein [Promineifilum sp.]
MTKASKLARALVSRQWWWVTLLVVALMLLLARLGIWQLDRLEQRRAANAQLLAAIESPPIDLNREIGEYLVMEPREVSGDLANRDVAMVGVYDYEQQRVLKLQSWDGRAGVHLITPLLLEGTDTAVLVDRGWIPDAAFEAGEMYADQTGTQTVNGYVALTETITRRTADAIVPPDPGVELFRVDIADLGKRLPYQLAPFYVKLAPQDGDSSELPIPTPKEIDLSEGPHLDYAFQWFIFSLGLGTAYVIYVNRWLNMRDNPPPAKQERFIKPL